MNEPSVPLARPDIGEEEIAAAVSVLRSGGLSHGPEVEGFETDMAKYLGLEYAVAVNSGTSALWLCLKALGVGAGDEVITSPFSFVASANAIVNAGATPVFVDIEPDTFNIDPSRIESAIGPRTRAILPVHVFGRPVPMGDVMDVARRHRLFVVEDACEAMGARLEGRHTGTWGDAGVFAFYANKPLTTAEGGMIVTREATLAERCRRLRNQGRCRGCGDLLEFGYSLRLSALQAALGRVQLTRLPQSLRRRSKVARHYLEALGDIDPVRLPTPRRDGESVAWFTFPVRWRRDVPAPGRGTVISGLRARGIESARYFPPIHLEPPYRERFGYRPGDYPVTEAISDESLALPLFSAMARDQVERVAEMLREILEVR